MTGDGLVGGGDGQTPVHPDELAGLIPRWISRQGQLDEVERQNVLQATRWALSRRRSTDTVLDDNFVRELHRRAFGSVWSWAGTYRTSAKTIGIDWQGVPVATRQLMLDARAWVASVGDDDRDAHDSILADVHHQLTVIHPFINGNGRTARLFVDVLAKSVERPQPTWGVGTPDYRERYLVALQRADSGELELLTKFLWS